MRITVLGSCGAWPAAGRSCSGFLVEHEGFRLLVDAGFATLPRLLTLVEADQVDAVWISHGHPDHCADLNPLLRARALTDEPTSPLPVYAPPGALDAVLALDRPGMLTDAYELREVDPGERYAIGPFDIDTRLLPHWLPNAGIRLTAGGKSLVYTGDAGPSPELATLAQGAELLVAEASYVDKVPDHSAGMLSTARDAGREASQGRRRPVGAHASLAGYRPESGVVGRSCVHRADRHCSRRFDDRAMNCGGTGRGSRWSRGLRRPRPPHGPRARSSGC